MASIDYDILVKLPESAREKLLALNDVAEAAAGAARQAQERLRTVGATTSAVRDEYQAAVRQRGGYGENLASDRHDPARAEKGESIVAALERLREKAEVAQNALNRAQQSAQATQDAWGAEGAQVERLSNFVLDLPTGTALTAVTTATPKLGNGELPLDAVERIRIEIMDIQSEIERVETAPVTVAEARQRAEEWVRQMAACAVADVDNFFRPNMGPVQFSTRQFEVRPIAGGHPMRGSIPDSVALAACANPEAFLARLLAEIDAVNDDPGEQIPLVDRPTMLVDLNTKLEAAERTEESIITGVFEGGIAIPRRPDVRPEVVLEVEISNAKAVAA